MTKKNEEKGNLSRRSFLKASSAVGAGAAVVGYTSMNQPLKTGTAYASGMYTKEHDDFPLELSADFEGYDQHNTIFMRARAGDEIIIDDFMTFVKKDAGIIPPTGEIGYQEIDVALTAAGWSVENEFTGNSSSGKANHGLYAWEGEINERKVTFESPEEATKTVKRAAQFLGADLVGIAPYDERWVYNTFYDNENGVDVLPNLPFTPKYVISMAFEMDYDAFKTAPSLIGSAAAGSMYSNMAVTAHKVATFVRRIGYQAIPSGNDTGMSIPIAISAGLGELSRAGILITEKYGPRVRLCKVFTDLELKPDKPITFGVEEFCKVCMKCADNCPSGAITKDAEPSYKVPTISNIKGVKKWTIDSEKCVKYWGQNGGDCGNCIGACPYNKLDEWQHNFAKLATVTPGLKTFAREFDELFGYGKTFNEKAMKEFWEYKEK